jgi:hypothetical protein
MLDELREIHLGLKPKRRTGLSVGEQLQRRGPTADVSEAQPAIA